MEPRLTCADYFRQRYGCLVLPPESSSFTHQMLPAVQVNRGEVGAPIDIRRVSFNGAAVYE
jgi:hypothetical protein